MKYAVISERTPRNFSAYVPDLPGCVATGRTRLVVERRIREAINLHIEALRATKQPIPEPSSSADIVEV